MDTTIRDKFYCVKYDYNSSEQDEEITFKKLKEGFDSYTTVHGIPHAANSKGAFKKCLWIILTLGCTAGLIYNLYAITNTYLAYHVYVRIDQHHSRNMVFPAVTICNTNPVKKSAISQSARLQALIAKWDSSSAKKRRKRAVASCSNAVEPTSGLCFWLQDDTNRKTYAEAETECASAGGKVAIIDTADKKNHIFDVIGLGSKSMWINLAYSSGSSNWIWDGSSPLGWSDWKTDPGTPPSSSAKTCVYISSISNTNHQWTNTECVGTTFYGTLYGLYTLCQDTATVATTTLAQTTTVEQTTIAPTTTVESTTTIEQTTIAPTTTIEQTTIAPTTTIEQTTIAPTTTIEQTTIAPTTTIEQTTIAPTTTIEQTTIAPTTILEHTTLADTTLSHTTFNDLTTTFSLTKQEATTLDILSTTQATTTTTIPSTTTTFFSVFPDREPPREDFQKESDVMEVLAELPADLKKEMGYNYPEFILECIYNTAACYEWHFDYFFDAVYGNCYVFNAGWNNTYKLFSSTQPGRKHGLQLYINLGQQEYLESVAESAGVVVVVHDQDRMPFPEDEGVFAQPGYISSVGTKRISVERLGDEYSDCTTTNDEEINVFSEHYGVQYSVNACEKTCYQKHVISTCKCADPQYPITGKAFGNIQTISCDARNSTQADCVYGLTAKYIQNELDCNCPLPCSDTLYTYSPSKIVWPSDKEKTTMEQKYFDNLTLTTSSTIDEYMKRNLLKVEVYLQEISFESMEEKPKYPLLRYISDIGAIIGLYVGCSILSVLELLELGLDSVVILAAKLVKYKNKPKEKINTPIHKARVMPLNLTRENSLNCLNDIEVKATGQHSSSAAVLYSDSDSNSLALNPRRINTTKARPRRGSIFDIFNKHEIEQVYQVSRGPASSSSRGDEGYGSSDSTPAVKPRHNNNRRWQPLHVALHEKFLFGEISSP